MGGAGASTDYYVFDGQSEKIQIDGENGNRTKRFVRGATGELMAIESVLPTGLVDNSRWLLTDGKGTVHDLVWAATGNVTQSYTFDQYGIPSSRKGAPLEQQHPLAIPFLYEGRRYDYDLNLHLMSGTAYDPVLRRFMTPIDGGTNPYVTNEASVPEQSRGRIERGQIEWATNDRTKVVADADNITDWVSDNIWLKLYPNLSEASDMELLGIATMASSALVLGPVGFTGGVGFGLATSAMASGGFMGFSHRYNQGASIGDAMLGGLLDATPVSGLYEAAYGEDIITGESVSGLGRVLGALSILEVLPVVRPGMMLARRTLASPMARKMLVGSAAAGTVMYGGDAEAGGFSKSALAILDAAKQASTATRQVRVSFDRVVDVPTDLVAQLGLHETVQRALLRDAVSGVVGLGQPGTIVHHLIPLDAVKEFFPVMHKAALGGFNVNGAENGIRLWDWGQMLKHGILDDTSAGLVRHFGHHPVYSETAARAIGLVNPRVSPATAAASLNDISATLRTAVIDNTFPPLW